MIIIENECVDNARNMLTTQATFLGWVGNIRYYVLDGKVWSINGAIISRSDDTEESMQIMRTVKGLNNDIRRNSSR